MRRSTAYSLFLAAFLALLPLYASAAPVIPLASDGASVSSEIDGVCAGCEVSDEDHVIADDLDAYATLYTLANVAGGASLSVRFPDEVGGGAKAGFRIGTSGLLDLGVLDGLTVSTYLAGEERASGTGTTLLSLQVLPDGTGQVLIRSKKSFDEVRIRMGGLLSVARNLRVYHALAIPKRERRTVTEFALASEGATVASDAGGLVCIPVIAPCDVHNEANVIADERNAFATMSLPVGLAAWAWVDVTFPEVKGTRGKAGFAIRDAAGLLDLELLSALTVTTYLNDEVQETASGPEALRLTVLGGTKKAVFFNTRQPFDRIRLTTSGLLNVGVQVRVYYAAVQYTESVSGLYAEFSPNESALTSTSARLTEPAPNPSTSSASLAVHVDEAQHVRVEVYDVRGRLVATPFEGRVETSTPVTVEARHLPAGVYVLRATGETFAATRRLTVAR